jgi:hypothetical protein
MRTNLLVVMVLSALAGGCASHSETDTVIGIAIGAPSTNPETVSLQGEPRFRPWIEDSRRKRLESDLAEALSAYQENPGGEAEVIWVGRRLGYLGRYRDAVLVFTEGLKQHPSSYRLLRHRGHRLITLRQFDEAMVDLLAAAERAESATDEVEPDGDPGPTNEPRSTDKSNIFYHLGLSLYLQGHYGAAAEMFGERRGLAGFNDDMIVSTTHWQYLALRRLGRGAEADAWLDQVRPEMDVKENHGYHRLCLMYKGLRTPEELLQAKADGSPQDAGLVYGVAAYLELQGERERARDLCQELVRRGNWASFGVIAAEADLARGPR